MNIEFDSALRQQDERDLNDQRIRNQTLFNGSTNFTANDLSVSARQMFRHPSLRPLFLVEVPRGDFSFVEAISKSNGFIVAGIEPENLIWHTTKRYLRIML